ncbi:unnamed protein product [Phytophthora lilii]|uniref:Unnamed protein product n=1 Tax=Phytophthora lilii TaxID=2077276 RepID=A0A9W6YJB9_9STRA|nr:unnamed protein product [Phytophthora lilii]
MQAGTIKLTYATLLVCGRLRVAELGGVGGGPAYLAQAARERATRPLDGGGSGPARHAVQVGAASRAEHGAQAAVS